MQERLEGFEIHELDDAELERACDALPLARLHQGDGQYLVAWRDGAPVGHVHLAWTTPPELQDLYVLPEHQRRGIGRALLHAGEDRCRRASCDTVTLTVSAAARATRSMYEALGYVDVGIEPRRVVGTIEVRSGPIDVDDLLLTLVKEL